MCGIIGYIGAKQVVPILMSGLERLEYRGYDSAGIAVYNNNEICIRKVKGRLQNLQNLIDNNPCQGHVGIGHTRWATHGEPSDINSHPHMDYRGEIAIVHNGIIENYLELKEMLISKGAKFVSDTDTEVIVNLLHLYYQGDMLKTILTVLPMLKGSYALGIMCRDNPDELYCTRKDSPLILGLAKHGAVFASDIPALIEHTRDVYVIEDMDVAVVRDNSISLYDKFGSKVQRKILHVDWDVKSAEKGGYEHFMLKEIHEEPESLKQTLLPLIDTDGEKAKIRQSIMPLDLHEAQKIDQILLLACGTAYHAGVVGKTIIERLVGIQAHAEIASEFRYRDAVIKPNTLVIIISQSGETSDTIAAQREAKKRGCKVIAITNVVGSTVSREADKVIYTWAGPEIAVASTKAYISQLMVLYVLAADIAHKRGLLSDDELSNYINKLKDIPEKAAVMLKQRDSIARFAHRVFDKHSVFYIGRGLDYALSMEASLKLKEISYIHSEAYAAGELKHGTIALIEPGTLVVALATQNNLIEKTLNNIKEVKVRGANVLAIADEKNNSIAKEADEVWYIPTADDFFSPLLAIIPLQLFAYYIALEKGCDIDKPRNLAKSVTVE